MNLTFTVADHGVVNIVNGATAASAAAAVASAEPAPAPPAAAASAPASSATPTQAREGSEDSEDSDDCEDSDSRDSDSDDGEETDGLPKMKAKRHVYDADDRASAVGFVNQVMLNGGSVVEAVKKLNCKTGWEKVNVRQVKKWMTRPVDEEGGKRGRKVNELFEKAVMDELIFSEVDTAVEAKKPLEVIANVMYSYNMIKQAAKKLQASAFLMDKAVQKLEFSSKWVVGFLHRNGLNRRRVTRKIKDLPSVETVRNTMSEIQKLIDDNKLPDHNVVSADETAVFYGAQPLNQYVQKDEKRGAVPSNNDKARFTALLWSRADGVMGPPFIIIKCSVKGTDLSSVRVLKTLLQNEYFKKDWTYGEWKRELTLKERKQMVTRLYIRPFLFHAQTRTVITVQHKAWADSVGTALWADVQLSHFTAFSGKMLVVWDNCGPHNVPAVKEVFNKNFVLTANLPPNMTDKLQVMDLAVNGPLKAAVRKNRCAMLQDYFSAWRVNHLKAKLNGNSAPFSPPSPNLAQGIKLVLETVNSSFREHSFRVSLHNTFVSVGLSRGDDGEYRKYSTHGVVSKRKHGKEKNAFTFKDMAAALVMGKRTDYQADEGMDDEEVVEIADDGFSDDDDFPGYD
jgi:hypothetical protein